MTLQIQIENRQKTIPLRTAALRKAAQKILRHEGIRRGELSLVFVTESQIRRFNKKYLGRDHATDVLAFDLKNDLGVSSQDTLQGDIIISTAAACKNARTYQTSPEKEIILYIAHGILHLLGYDDHQSGDIKKMRAKERELISLIDSNP